MTEFRYHLLAIFAGLVLAAYSVIGTLGGAPASAYQLALLIVGLVIAVAFAFHLGTLWERRDNEPHSR
jgi:hypothetical protein